MSISVTVSGQDSTSVVSAQPLSNTITVSGISSEVQVTRASQNAATITVSTGDPITVTSNQSNQIYLKSIDLSSLNTATGLLNVSTGLLSVSTGNLDSKITRVSGLLAASDADLNPLNIATGVLKNEILNVSGLITSNDSDITSLNSATGFLNSSVNSLNTATGLLTTATGNLDAKIITVSGLIVSNDIDLTALNTATGLLNAATGSLKFDTSNNEALILSNASDISSLRAVTGDLFDATGFLNTATGVLSTATGNLDSKIITISGLINSNDTDLTALNIATGFLNTNVIGLQTATGSLKSDISSNDSDISSLQIATGLILTSGEIDTNINIAIANLVSGAPSTLNTLNELAAALGDDANFSTTIATSLGNLSTATGDLDSQIIITSGALNSQIITVSENLKNTGANVSTATGALNVKISTLETATGLLLQKSETGDFIRTTGTFAEQGRDCEFAGGTFTETMLITAPNSDIGLNIQSPNNKVSFINFGDFDLVSGGSIRYDNPSDSFQIRTSGDEALNINTSGDVNIVGKFGIGTSSPQAKLHVNGNTILSGALTVTGNINSPNVSVLSGVPSDLSNIKSVTGVLNTNIISLNTATGLLVQKSETGVLLTSGEIQTNIDTAVANLVDSAPGTLNTLNELAAALGDDQNFSATTATSLGNLSTATGVLNTNVNALQAVSGSFAQTGSTQTATFNEILLHGDLRFQEANEGIIFTNSLGQQRYGLKVGNADNLGGSDNIMFTNREVSGNLLFGTAGTVGGSAGETERMRITHDGNVGIGTTGAENKLHVNSATTNEVAKFESTDGTAYISIQDSNSSNSLHGYGCVGDNLTLYASGAERVRITDSGNVGIGTSSPNEALEVIGNILSNGIIKAFNTTPNTAQLEVGRSASEFLEMKVNDSNVFITANQDSDSDGNHHFILDRVFAGSGANDFEIRKGGTAQVTVDTSGNVGIGTTSPRSNLDVGGSVISSKTLAVEGQDNPGTNGPAAEVQYRSSDNAGRFYSYDRSTSEYKNVSIGDDYIYAKNDGNVGIGTNTPSQKLHVSGGKALVEQTSSAGSVIVNRTDGKSTALVAAGLESALLYDSAGFFSIQARSSSNVLAGNGDTNDEVIRIDSAGNIGIGASSPDAQLHVKSTGDAVLKLEADTDNVQEGHNPLIRFVQDSGLISANIGFNGNSNDSFTGAIDNAFYIENTSPAAGFGAFQIATNNNASFTIDNNSNVGIGTTSPQAKLQVGGDTILSGHVGIGASSPQFPLDIGGTTSSTGSTIRINQNNGGTAIRIGAGGGGSDVVLMRLDGETSNHDGLSDSSNFGFSMKYMGSLNGNDNALRIISDNQQGTAVNALNILQDGSIGLNTVSPAARLHVNGDTILSGNLTVNGDVKFGTGTAIGPLHLFGTGNTDTTLATFENVSGGNDPDANVKLISRGAGESTIHFINKDNTHTNGYQIGHGDAFSECLFFQNKHDNRTDMVISQAGRVGIGETSPNATLHVDGDTILSGNLDISGSITPAKDVAFDIGSPTKRFKDLYLSGDSIFLGDTKLSVSGDELQTAKDGVVKRFIKNTDTGNFASLNLVNAKPNASNPDFTGDNTFFRGNSKFFRTVVINGNVGIGTTSPVQDLELNRNNANVNLNIRSSNAGNATLLFGDQSDVSAGSVTYDNSDDSMRFKVNNQQEKMRITSTGNVGIGITDPRGILDIYGTNAQAIIRATGENQDATLFLGTPHTNERALKTAIIAEGQTSYSRAKLHFCLDNNGNNTAPTYNASLSNSRMTIQPNGNVGIGTTSPESKLDINAAGSNDGMRVISSSDNRIAHFRLAGGTRELLQIGGEIDSISKIQIGTSVTTAPAITINSSDNVGIGTTNPSAKLEVSGNVTAAEPTSSTHLTTKNYVDTQVAGIVDSAPSTLNTLNELAAALGDDANFSTTTASSLGNLSTATGVLNTNVLGLQTATGSLKSDISSNDSDISALQSVTGSFAQTGSSTFGSLNVTGNVGIGTTSPTTTLHVSEAGDPNVIFENKANTSLDRHNTLTFKYSDGIGAFIKGIRPSGLLRTGTFLALGAGGNTERLRIDALGNVGIGTNSPDKLLVVEGANGEIVINDTNSTPLLRLRENGITKSTISTNGFGSLAFTAGGSTERMRIDSAGKVGIGTTSPNELLHVEDSSSSSGTSITIQNAFGESPKNIKFRHNDTVETARIEGYGRNNASQLPYLAFHVNQTTSSTASNTVAERMRINSSGNVGIGTTSPSAKLEVNGHFAATTKSFIIDNPEKGGRLQYGVVETDEHSVYVRGKSNQEEVELPEEWDWLVHEDSVTVQLTSVGQIQQLFVVEQNNKKIKIGGLVNGGQYNYVVYGTRKDVDPLEKHLK